MALADAIELAEWFSDRGYVPTHPKPREADAAALSHWTASNKHSIATDRDKRFLRQYVAIVLAAGATLAARGIALGPDRYVHLDLAVMNSCLNAKLVTLNETAGVF